MLFHEGSSGRVDAPGGVQQLGRSLVRALHGLLDGLVELNLLTRLSKPFQQASVQFKFRFSQQRALLKRVLFRNSRVGLHELVIHLPQSRIPLRGQQSLYLLLHLFRGRIRGCGGGLGRYGVRILRDGLLDLAGVERRLIIDLFLNLRRRFPLSFALDYQI